MVDLLAEFDEEEREIDRFVAEYDAVMEEQSKRKSRKYRKKKGDPDPEPEEAGPPPLVIKTADVVLPKFYDFWAECDKAEGRKLWKVLKGGRGSSKSSHIALRIIYDIMNKPVNALVMRKVARTLEKSVFEQLKWAVDQWHAKDYFRFKKHPLEIIYKPRGNGIFFAGSDDPGKIKSMKTSDYPVTILWLEEAADWKTEESVSMIVNSILRGELPDGLFYDIYLSYNPPKRKQAWVNKTYDSVKPPKNAFVHHSTYLDNPYISKEFIEQAEAKKEKNELAYRWEYLGEPIGSGVVPFNNLKFRPIKDKEISRFDNIRQGNDWGYASDPLAFVRLHYDKTRRVIFIFDEIHGVKISNRDFAYELISRGYQHDYTIADSAEPKSVDEVADEGVNIGGAIKGPGSVEFGEKWLDELEAIVIDPDRCPHTAEEFEQIDYQVDKDGDPLAKLEDKNNHSIDATRYALENDMDYRFGVRGGQSAY